MGNGSPAMEKKVGSPALRDMESEKFWEAGKYWKFKLPVVEQA